MQEDHDTPTRPKYTSSTLHPTRRRAGTALGDETRLDLWTQVGSVLFGIGASSAMKFDGVTKFALATPAEFHISGQQAMTTLNGKAVSFGGRGEDSNGVGVDVDETWTWGAVFYCS